MLTTLRRKKDAKRDFDPFRERTEEEIEAERRAQVIAEAIERRFKELSRAQAGVASEQRLSKQQCRAQAEADVHGAIRAAEREARNARIKADLASTWTRNEYLFKPWFAGAGYLASGELAAVLAEAGALTSAGPVLAAAAGAAGTTWLAWKKWLMHLPQRHIARLRLGMAGGCGMCVALPMLPWDWHPMAVVAGAAAVLASSAGYRRSHEPSYPPMGGYNEAADAAEAAARTVESAEAAPAESDAASVEAAEIISDWDEFVRDGKILPGAGLERPREFEHGWVFTVKLVRGQQRFDTLQKAMPDIATALNQPLEALQADPNPDPYKPLLPTLTLTTSTPDTTYRGPVIVRVDGSVFIELGPYTDGRGVVRYELFSDQLSDEELARGESPRGNVIGGFLLGDKGSGKTRMMEGVALAAKSLGVEIWYLDPQGGTSSPLLRDNAAWPLMGLDSPDGRGFGNVEDLLEALEGLVAVRQDENSAHGWTRFQHSRQRPAVLVCIDECHQVFAQYGHRFGDIDRVAQKLGVAFLGASQAPTQDVFGGSITLRNGMAGANGFVLKYNGSNARLAFGGLDDEIARGCQRLPINRGYGYAVNSARPHAVFQARYTPNLQPYFAQVGETALDELARVGAGETYARRHETAEANLAEVQRRLDGYRNGTLTPGKGGQKPKSSTRPASGGSGTATAGSGTVSYLFPGSGSQPVVDPQPTRESLTARQHQILQMLDGASLNAKEIAAELGVTNRTISTDLKNLREAKFVRLVDENEGRYVTSADLA